MTHSQACRPCSKRKVRCDRLEPCSNCKRRKTDQCTYPPSTPSDRIRQLESIVRELGGNPGGHASVPVVAQGTTERNGIHTPTELRSNDPMMIEENGEVQYLESRAWEGWRGKIEDSPQKSQRQNFASRPRPHAMAGLMFSPNAFDVSAEPLPLQRVNILWNIFSQRVEPFVRIIFRSVKNELRTKSSDIELHPSLTTAEHALIMAICYASINSLTDQECGEMLQLQRSSLLAEYQARCEDALLRTNLLCMTDLNTIRALVFYIMGSFDRISTQSLWSLMGLTIRNAEKLGLHRDGAVLGLSPLETEERRRLWWQLQHLDLGGAVRLGLTPMTLTAGWDVKMPSNIEDDDIRPGDTTIPKERKGLTSISYNLFCYWVLQEQRQTFLAKHGRFELSWQTNTTISGTAKDDMVSRLEDGINCNFLQYCDPINPLHVLLQLFARSFVTSTKLRVLHARACDGLDTEHRTALLNAASQTLRYSVALQSQTSLINYRWLTRAWLSWQAVMIVLVEASETSDISKAQELWDLIDSVYACNIELLDLEEDRRKSHAAEQIVAGWTAHPDRIKRLRQPTFIPELTRRLAVLCVDPQVASQRQGNDEDVPNMMPEEFDLGLEFDMDLGDIDWGFWSSID